MKDVKRLEKKHGQLKRRRMEELTTTERIWHWYFNMEYDITLTKTEEQTRLILEFADKLIIKYYPSYSLHKIASYLSRKIKTEFNLDRTSRQCLTYVQDAITVFGEPVEVEKEWKRSVYINRLNYLSKKAEDSKDYNAAIKAIDKAAELENFNKGDDELLKKLMSEMDAKEITFAASKEQLEAIIAQKRKKYIEENSEDAEVLNDD